MKKETFVARVPSLTNARLRYDVTLKDGELFCACPAFYSWRKRGEKCWHLRVWEAASRALDRCWNDHGTPDGFVCQACLLALLSKAAGVVKAEYVTVIELKEKVTRVRASKKKKRAKKRSVRRIDSSEGDAP